MNHQKYKVRSFFIIFFGGKQLKNYFCIPFDKEKRNTMKKDIHPASYRTVVFKDISNDEAFLGKSCANTKDTIKWEDGNEYPLIKMEISSFSHHFLLVK